MDERALQAIGDERDRQDAKWGEQNHSPWQWLCILMEEVGEAAKDTGGVRTLVSKDCRSYRKELVHVAAVAVTAMECFDRNPKVDSEVVHPGEGAGVKVAGEMPGEE